MATADTADGDTRPMCARDFVEERLRDAETPLSPSELAEEYGCTNGHVRNVMLDMVADDEAERVAHGQYVAATNDEDGVSDDLRDDLSESSEGNTETATDGVAPEETTQETGEPVDGEARSVDLGADETGDLDDRDGSGEPEFVDVDHGDQEDRDGHGDGELEEVESGGIPLPVSTTTAFVGIGVLLFLVYWFRVRPAMKEDQNAEATEQKDEQEQSGGGLIGSDVLE